MLSGYISIFHSFFPHFERLNTLVLMNKIALSVGGIYTISNFITIKKTPKEVFLQILLFNFL